MSSAYGEVEDVANGDASETANIARQAKMSTTVEAYTEVKSQYIHSIAECEPILDHYISLFKVSDARMNEFHEHGVKVTNLATATVAKSMQKRSECFNVEC